MPLVQVFTSAAAPADGAKELLADLSKLAAASFGKPERWVMTCLAPGLQMTFGGDGASPAAFVAVRNVGEISGDLTDTLSREICARVSKALGVPSDRIYIEFGEAIGMMWGWNGETFG
jgi:phenylpyruvate tautomerase PptA (4-oxalocrotonate tautomerase family)